MSNQSNGGSSVCPANPVWADVKGFFTPLDVSSMNQQSAHWPPGAPLFGPMDLSDYSSVKAHAQLIVTAVITDGIMPCDDSGESWSSDMMNCFQTWVNNGCPEN